MLLEFRERRPIGGGEGSLERVPCGHPCAQGTQPRSAVFTLQHHPDQVCGLRIREVDFAVTRHEAGRKTSERDQPSLKACGPQRAHAFKRVLTRVDDRNAF
jgi:hypothetical protein